jgi:hypothetical protein
MGHDLHPDPRLGHPRRDVALTPERHDGGPQAPRIVCTRRAEFQAWHSRGVSRESFSSSRTPRFPGWTDPSAELFALPEKWAAHRLRTRLIPPFAAELCAMMLWEVRRKLSSEAEGRYFHGNVQVQNGYSKRPKRCSPGFWEGKRGARILA